MSAPVTPMEVTLNADGSLTFTDNEAKTGPLKVTREQLVARVAFPHHLAAGNPPARTVSGCAKGTACEMSSASARARAVSLSTSTISRPIPRITNEYAAVAPTSPVPTIPTFTGILLDDR